MNVLFGTAAADFRPPAGDKAPVRGANGSSILPGGRVVRPLGTQIPTGPGTFKIWATPSGRKIATANLGPEKSSVTFLEQDRKGEWSLRSFVTPLSGGIVFGGEKSVWVSDGDKGTVHLMDVESGSRKKLVDLNQGVVHDSFSGDLAFDSARGWLFVADEAHSRVVVFDARSALEIATIDTAGSPHAISLSPDGKRLYALSSHSVSVADVSGPASRKIIATIPIENGGNILATSDGVFVSNPHEDSVAVIDPVTQQVRITVPLRLPGLESLRGIEPLGMAFDESRHWLLVAEAGINAVGVISVGVMKTEVLGLLPVGWFPTSILCLNGAALVANAKGRGTGPSPGWRPSEFLELEGVWRRGSVSRFELPQPADFEKQTRLVLAANGLLQVPDHAHPNIPIHHVVIVVKGSRSFDDILGDMQVPGSTVAGYPSYARFGNEGYADGGRKRFSLKDVPVTPNHHALAERFSFSDNFYADSDPTNDYLKGAPVFGSAFDGKASDQSRAASLISELEDRYRKPGVALPPVVVIRLPNDTTAAPNPQEGYPYSASYVADNDLALGRVVDYLSHSPWWRDMAIFITEADAENGRDHVDSHRTVFLAVSPWFRRGYVSHVNADYGAILKSTLHLLGRPALGLWDAAAADLGDLFAAEPDYMPYVMVPIDPRLYVSDVPGHPDDR